MRCSTARLSEGGGTCFRLVALDGLVDEELRSGLLSLLHGPAWPPEKGADPEYSWRPRLCL